MGRLHRLRGADNVFLDKCLRSLLQVTCVNERFVSPESDTQHLSSFLSSFLRFCTGYDLFTGKSITGSFTQFEEFQRSVAGYLELPVSFGSYPDFRHEMIKILESNMWVMNICLKHKDFSPQELDHQRFMFRLWRTCMEVLQCKDVQM